MMQNLWCTALVLLPASAAFAQEVVIDFDELPAVQFMVTLPNGTVITATPEGTFIIRSPDGTEIEVPKEFVPDGVIPGPGEVPIAASLPADLSPHATFSTSAAGGLYYFSGADAVGTSFPNNITAAVDPNAFPYSEPLYVDFTTPVNNLSFTVSSDNDSGKIAEVVVNYFGGQATLDVVGNGDFSDAIPMDLSAFANVTRVEIVNVTDEFGLSYDDFRFFPTNIVPEPTAISLASGMLLILATCTRSRR